MARAAEPIAAECGRGLHYKDSAGPRGMSAGSRVLALGPTFKENPPELCNSKVVDLIAALRHKGCQVAVHDPLAGNRCYSI